ncbi:hypothetical protein FSARC_7314 [Fusarium sarcochroum]|uniref:Uncharacterized protein n=1 Tax=Fusarium sarcochroum TaxID=1208366 RepID=A0A8H4X7G3_9HYPO|nr:hypothetical protein FSARC_7314 [Fusarium sarcochroum]
MKTGFVAFVLAAAAPLALAAPFPQSAPGGFWPPPFNGTAPWEHRHNGGEGPGSWLPQPTEEQQGSFPTPPAIPTPPPVVPTPPPSVPDFPPPAAPTEEPVVAPTPTPFARK